MLNHESIRQNSFKIFTKMDIHCWFMFGWFVFLLVSFLVGWLVGWLIGWLVGLSFWKVLWLRPSEPAVGRHFYIGSVQPWKAGGIEDFPVVLVLPYFFSKQFLGGLGVEGMSGGCWWCVDVNCIVWWAMMSVFSDGSWWFHLAFFV